MTARVEPRTVLQARATVARRLVKDGMDGYTALAYVVWPTARMLEAEGKVAAGTMHFRATSYRTEKAA